MDNFVIGSDDAPLIIPPIKNKSELLRLDHLKDIFHNLASNENHRKQQGILSSV